MSKELETEITVNGYTFELNDDCYSCRGSVYYDDDHDEMAEPGLMEAAYKLEDILKEQGVNSESGYSEKGWVDISILN
jgi:hypothetical protein